MARKNKLSALQVKAAAAVIIIIVSVGQYLLSREYDDVTGEKHQFGYTVAQEIEIGSSAAPDFIRENGGEVSGRAAELVRRLGSLVVKSSIANKSAYRFEFHLLKDDDTINAFALPGGHIFITRALLRKLKNEAQLAGVLGHEVGHVVHRHSSRQQAKENLGSGLVHALLALLTGDDKKSGDLAKDAAEMVADLVLMKYGRKDETESDMFGLTSMAQAGFDPKEMVGVMKILGEASGDQGASRISEWSSSHPLSEHRVEDIMTWLKQQYPRGVPPNLGKGNSIPK